MKTIKKLFPRRNAQPEASIQMAVIRWINCNYPETIYTMSPAGMKMTMRQAMNVKRMGYTAGTPDLMIFEPRGNYHGLFIELKTETGTIQPTQAKMLFSLMQRGYHAVVCKGFDKAIEKINWYMTHKIPL